MRTYDWWIIEQWIDINVMGNPKWEHTHWTDSILELGKSTGRYRSLEDALAAIQKRAFWLFEGGRHDNLRLRNMQTDEVIPFSALG